MNPYRIGIYVKGYNERDKRNFELSNIVSHIQGMYFAEAILSTIGNMFSDKNTKPYEYPKHPYEFGKSQEELTEEEIQKQRDLFVARFMAMQENFRLAKGLANDDSE